MGVHLDWLAGDMEAEVRADAAAFAEKVAKYVTDYIVKKLSRPYPPASEGGEYPRQRTGGLIDSIDYREGKESGVQLIVQDYDVAHYGGFLELGTKRMEPRPFFVRGCKQGIRNARRMLRWERTVEREQPRVNRNIRIRIQGRRIGV